MDPGVIAGETRRVTTMRLFGEENVLWVAPTEAGGFCVVWSKFGGGCDRLGTVPLSVTWASIAGSRDGGPTITHIDVHADADYVHAVRVMYADGDTVRLPLVWVSRPINAGFTLYEVPAEHRAPGHEIVAVDALDARGDLVTRSYDDPAQSGDVDADAIVERARVVQRSRNEGGEAVLWQAPTRYDGTCTWVEYQDRRKEVGCLPRGYGVREEASTSSRRRPTSYSSRM